MPAHPTIHIEASDFENGSFKQNVAHNKKRELPSTIHWLKEEQLIHEANLLFASNENSKVIQPPHTPSMVHITPVELVITR